MAHDLWLLVSLVPYALAYASYRGAVVVAHEYGMTLASLVDLNRFAPYERMHLPHPKNTRAGQRLNRHQGSSRLLFDLLIDTAAAPQ